MLYSAGTKYLTTGLSKMRINASEFNPGSGLFFGALKISQGKVVHLKPSTPCKEVYQLQAEWEQFIQPKLLAIHQRVDFALATLEIQNITLKRTVDAIPNAQQHCMAYFDFCQSTMHYVNSMYALIKTNLLYNKISKQTAAISIDNLLLIVNPVMKYSKKIGYIKGRPFIGDSNCCSKLQKAQKVEVNFHTMRIQCRHLVNYLKSKISHPLHQAILMKDEEQIAFLLKLGLSPYTKNTEDLNALQYAKKLGHNDMLEFLSGKLKLQNPSMKQ